MGRRIETEVDIAASPETVWEVLTDLDRYEEWNPFVTSSQGRVAVGETLRNRLEPPGGRTMTFAPRVTVADEPRVFEWLGKLGVSGVFDGRHRFELEPTQSGTRLVHSEEFGGIAVPFLMGAKTQAQTREGFVEMNDALRARCEARAEPTE